MDLVERTDGPIHEAHGLPRAAYTAQDFVALEQRQLFGRSWHAVGFAHDVQNVGDVYPVASPAGHALVLLRDKTDCVRVFHNYCRHRGMRLVDKPMTGRKNIVCPYHAWCYHLDGRISRIPHRDGFEKHAEEPTDVPGLRAVRSETWAGIVFVDLSGEAGEFSDHIAPMAKRWAHYDLSLLRHGVSMSFGVPGNWKLAIENFIDIYHVPYVHPSLNKYNDMVDHYFIEEGNVVLGQGNGAFVPVDEGVGKLPRFPNLTTSQHSTSEAVCLFPNLLLTIFNDNLRAILVEPTGPASCHERVEIFFVGDESQALELEPYRTIVADRFPRFNLEDVAVVTKLQKSFTTSAFERAHFNSFFDGNVHHFQQLVSRACAD